LLQRRTRTKIPRRARLRCIVHTTTRRRTTAVFSHARHRRQPVCSPCAAKRKKMQHRTRSAYDNGIQRTVKFCNGAVIVPARQHLAAAENREHYTQRLKETCSRCVVVRRRTAEECTAYVRRRVAVGVAANLVTAIQTALTVSPPRVRVRPRTSAQRHEMPPLRSADDGCHHVDGSRRHALTPSRPPQSFRIPHTFVGSKQFHVRH